MNSTSKNGSWAALRSMVLLIIGMAGSICLWTQEGSLAQAEVREGASNKRRGEVVAHRGLGEFAPENSILSFEIARERGFRVIEADIVATSDDRLVVFHDHDLRRLGDKRPVCKVSAEDLQQISLAPMLFFDVFKLPKTVQEGLVNQKDGWLKQLQNTRVPTLERLLNHFGDSFYYHLDLKNISCTGREPEMIQQIGRLIEAAGLSDRVFIESQKFELLATIKVFFPEIQTIYWREDLGKQPIEFFDLLRKAKIGAVDFHWTRFQESQHHHFKNFMTFTYTVNAYQDIERLRPHFDYIITDFDYLSSPPLNKFEFFNQKASSIKIFPHQQTQGVKRALGEGFELDYSGPPVVLRKPMSH